MRILLSGASGYVGGRLLTALTKHLGDEDAIRCLVRRPESLAAKIRSIREGATPPGASVEPFKGDVLDRASLDTALQGIDIAYYLVHSMGAPGASFQEADRTAAHTFAEAARHAGVRRIVYLGGLGDGSGGRDPLSAHLQSRQEVGAILRSSRVPVIEFRAAIVIGSGSLSFEMIRALVERLPVMITPRWVRTMTQPIGIEDLIAYLVAAISVTIDEGIDAGSRIFEIGGSDRVSYGDLMKEYAQQRGLTRLMIPVPVLSARLSSLWLGLVTPLYARIGRKLVESLRHETVVTDEAARRAFSIVPVSTKVAIARALANEDQEIAETRWSDALSSAGKPREFGGVRFGARLVDSRALASTATPSAAFVPIRRIGGDAGWYWGNMLWKIRGLLDLGVGGVGVRRGRRAPDALAVGDTLDFWRVEEYEPDRRLRLAAEMKLPGRAWLEFEVIAAGGEALAGRSRAGSAPGARSVVRQTAIFDPLGLSGLAYWYALYPLHLFVFRGMLREIVKRGEAASPSEEGLGDCSRKAF